MRLPEINPLAEALAIAAGLCFGVIEVAFELMRRRANERLPHEQRISFFWAKAMRKKIIVQCELISPREWEYRAYRTSRALWLMFVILSILALFFGSSA
jgi:hypothetical protein